MLHWLGVLKSLECCCNIPWHQHINFSILIVLVNGKCNEFVAIPVFHYFVICFENTQQVINMFFITYFTPKLLTTKENCLVSIYIYKVHVLVCTDSIHASEDIHSIILRQGCQLVASHTFLFKFPCTQSHWWCFFPATDSY